MLMNFGADGLCAAFRQGDRKGAYQPTFRARMLDTAHTRLANRRILPASILREILWRKIRPKHSMQSQ